MNDRSGYIGGSDIAAILGISPWRNPVDLWLSKIQPQPDEDSLVKKRGRRMEPYILSMIAEEFNVPTKTWARNVRHIDEAVPYSACEVDAEAIYLAEDENSTRSLPVIENIEIKTVHPFKANEWGEAGADQLPLHYLAQAQWGLGVTRRDVCRVFALIGDDLRPYVVERDEPTINAMRARAHDFWERYVLAGERPPLDYDDPHTLDLLKRLYPGTNGKTIEATPELERWRLTMQEARAAADKYENVFAGAKAHLLDAMGEAALLTFADGKALRRKLTKRKGYTVAETEYMDARFVTVKDQK
jgi:putative phage-type endonuclease